MNNSVTTLKDPIKLCKNQITDSEYRSYLNKISRFPLLTAEEEAELAHKIKDGDKSALDKLVNCNLRLSVSVAKKYYYAGADLFDLIQQGNIGLIRAAKNYDPSLGYRFSTFATSYIRGECFNYIAAMKYPISISNHKLTEFHKIKKVAENDLNKDISDLTNTDISRIARITKMSYKN